MNRTEEDPQKRRKKRSRAPVVIVLAIALVAVCGFGVKTLYDDSLRPAAPGDTTPVAVSIPEGASTSQIAEILHEQGLISNTWFFRYHSKSTGYDGKYKEGDYTLSKSMSPDQIAAVLIAGTKAATKKFTIPEGYNNTQIAKKLADEGICSEADFWNEAENGSFDYPFLKDCPAGKERLEGFLYPETYEVYTDASAHDVIDKMLAEFGAQFKPEYYDHAQEMGYSVRDIVTMGSIIERESVSPAERPVMAAVFYNRLKAGMDLQSCATIQYILGTPKEFLTDADTQIESPYNTYLHEGLPPGPICNPRMASIEAALYPDQNDDLYFVLSPNLDGTHNFSADYATFLKNKDAYYAAVDAQEAQKAS
ncbi:MAG: endolytic transglycosylase MltG [Clostridiales bacterium]|nr:endolytic transglycosylase MltG [Clostridiales bacterium]